MADTQPNPVNQMLQAKFNADAASVIAAAWNDLGAGKNPDQTVATFKTAIAELRARRDKLEAAAAVKT